MRRWSEKAVLASVPEEDREFVIGIWPPEFERILNGESVHGREVWLNF